MVASAIAVGRFAKSLSVYSWYATTETVDGYGSPRRYGTSYEPNEKANTMIVPDKIAGKI